MGDLRMANAVMELRQMLHMDFLLVESGCE